MDPDPTTVAIKLTKQGGRARRRGHIFIALTLIVGGFIFYALGTLQIFPNPFSSAFSSAFGTGPISGMNATAVGQAISSVIVRIGAVLVGIFLIQILVSFTRYQYRLAEHLSMCSHLVRLTGGNADSIEALAPVMLPFALDFGKMPASPLQNIIERLIDKLPSSK